MDYLSGMVSIIVPCYNGAKYLERFFDSILMQTYVKLQMIFVNDGSQDESEYVAQRYKSIFESKGMEFVYVFQQNKGQAAAINKGIPYIRGEYLMWIDCDDYLEENHVQKKVDFLQEYKDIDVVMCRGNIYAEDKPGKCIGMLGAEPAIGSIFEDVLFTYRCCQCGLYMVRTKKLFQVNPQKRIYESRVGQNMQLLLPILAHDNVGYIEDRLYNYIVHAASHSHEIKGGISWKKRYDQLHDMKLQVLNMIPLKGVYKEKIMHDLEVQDMTLRLYALDSEIEMNDPEYTVDVSRKYIKISGVLEEKNERDIYIWGIGKRAGVLSEYLEKYGNIQIQGYIESSPDKRICNSGNYRILSPNEINREKMFIFIPLAKYYPEIIDKLRSAGFEERKDFFYPVYELQNAIKERKDECLF